MIVGIPKEIKPQENRVGMVPAGVKELVDMGAEVLVETVAGRGSGFSDSDYAAVGAKVAKTSDEVWKNSELIIKVKEPLKEEFPKIQEKQNIYTYLHLAVAPELADLLMEKKVTGIAYETIQRKDGSLPLLKPMSEVAGKMSVQAGATHLQKEHGGRGVLLGGVPGVRRGRVTILGGGTVGTNACKIAVGLGANVAILDVNLDRLEYLDDIFENRITTLKSSKQNIEDSVADSDLVIGAVLVAGARAPRLVTREMLHKMIPGSVIVDVAVDQGGCVETSKPTTHLNPTYVVDGVVHYCVANMPGAVSHSSTFALSNVTLPYARRFVKKGILESIRQDEELALGVNTFGGYVVHSAVAEGLGKEYKELKTLL